MSVHTAHSESRWWEGPFYWVFLASAALIGLVLLYFGSMIGLAWSLSSASLDDFVSCASQVGVPTLLLTSAGSALLWLTDRITLMRAGLSASPFTRVVMCAWLSVVTPLAVGTALAALFIGAKGVPGLVAIYAGGAVALIAAAAVSWFWALRLYVR